MSRFSPRVVPRPSGRTTVAFLAGVLTVALACALVEFTPLPSLVAAPLVRPDTPGTAETIVVLGGGVDAACAPDFHSTRRTILAARLFREGRAPLLLFTGGKLRSRDCAVSDVMAGLARELGVPDGAILTERSSRNTWENAVEASRILRPRGVGSVLLVSDSLHLRRGEACMRRVGFDVLRASVPTVDAYFDGLDLLRGAVHEYLGWWYYELRGRV